MSEIWSENRIADENIYLNEDRYAKPKEVHKKILEVINRNIKKEHKSLLDCGTATGELLHLLKKEYPNLKYRGFDISQSMISKAKEKVPDAEFFVQDIQKHYKNWVKQPKDDLVIASGVLCIFDDYEKILNNILSCTRKNGVIIIRTIINYDPIDVIMRYKRSGSNEWESGWNILSKETLNDFLINKKFIESVDWDDYIMPFEIKKNSHDVMRAHTKLINNQKILVNGACQILNQTNLIIKLKK